MDRSIFSIKKESPVADSLKSFSFANLLQAASLEFGRYPAFSDRSGGRWRSLDFRDCARRSNAIAHWLEQKRLNTRCMIFAESRLEWPLAFFGIMNAGAVAIPVDAKSTAQELATFIRHTQPAVLMLSPKLQGVAEQAAELAQWQGPLVLLDLDNQRDSRAIGTFEAAPASFRPHSLSANSTAVIAFTSATSGQPKAVETSVRNLFHQMQSLRDLFGVKPGDALLSILPLSHLLELSCGFLAAFASGAHINYLNSILPNEIKDALKQRGITHMIVVPLLMDMIRKGIERNFTTKLGSRGATVLQGMQLASSLAPTNPMRRFLNRFILSELGPKLNTLIVGGATLDPSTLTFFNNLGINAWQGYGLTETSPVAAVNSPGQIKRGSVGRAMPGCSIRIEAAPGEKIGEILIKGPCIMNGYFNDRAYTREAIDQQDWFHTGDLGYVCDDGYLFITGRKKNLIVLDGGKKVYPEEVEKVLSASLLFQELCVTGLKVPHPSLPGKLTEQVSAVIVPQAQLRESKNLADLQTLCEQEVQRLCRELSSYKRPVQVIVQLDELPKTRTGKVKAPLVQQQLSASKA